jgi:hypothetical protein
MDITPLPEGAIKDGVKTHIFYEWYKDNEEAISKVFEEAFLEWFIADIANVKDITFGKKIKI